MVKKIQNECLQWGVVSLDTVKRQSGIDAVGIIPWGSHFCQFYETQHDLVETLVPYFRAGLEANEFCMWITSHPLNVSAAKKALETAMPEAAHRIAQGQMEILDYSQWYTKSGTFRSDEVLQGWMDKLQGALDRGYEGLRLTGNTFWLEQKDWQDFTKYEEAINTVIGSTKMIALCTYSLQKCGASEIAEVIANHEFALLKRAGKWQIIQSPHHKETEQALLDSELRYRSLYTAMDEGMAIHEVVYDDKGAAKDYRIIDVNPAYERITGLKRAQTVNTLASALYGTGKPPYLKLYAKVAEGAGSESFETHFTPMDKSFRISVFSPSKGRFVTVFEDITERKKNEQALRQSEEKFSTMFQAAPVSMSLAVLADGKIYDVNNAWLAFTGYASREEVIGKTALELGIIRDTHQREAVLDEFRRSGSVHNVEIEFFTKTGVQHTIRTSLDRIEINECPFILSAIEDITDYKRALRRFELLAQTAGELLQTRQPQKAVQILCEKVMRHLDCHAFFNFLVDSKTGRLHLNAFAGVSDEEAKRIEWLDFGMAVCGCVARDGHRIVAEHIPTTTDPRTELVKSYGIKAYACHPLIGPEETVIGTLSFGTASRETFDEEELSLMKAVTDQVAVAMIRMHSERQLQESREDLCRAQTVGQIGSWRLDVGNNILTWSDENYHIFGVPLGTPLTYETFLSFIHPDDREYVDTQWRAGLQGEPYDIEHRIFVQGQVKWVREKAYLEIDDAGTLLSGFGITQDITRRKVVEEELRKYREGLEKIVDERSAELRQSQEQLLQSQKMEALGQLAGGIAHDFNNMIQVVTGFAHRSLRNLDFENPLRENLEYIQQAAKSAAALTHRLLAFSRKQILQPRVLSLNDLILKTKAMLHHALGEDIDISYNLQSGLGRIKADPAQLEQVIMNMAINARNAMPKGGRLVIQTADVMLDNNHFHEKDTVPAGKYIMLAISDTGCGMDKETMGKIFEPFFTTRPFGTGSGLGLSMAYGTIRQSGGTIRVYSEPGKGTTFKIYLPRSEEALKPEESPAFVHHRTEGAKTILVVEDNSMALELASLELGDLGHKVLLARNAEEAFSLSRNHKGVVDLLLTDVVLPGAGGLEISETLSAERPEMASLFMSGYDEELVVKQGKLIAGSRLLTKPFSPEQLALAIEKALSSRSSEGDKKANSYRMDRTGASGSKRILVVDDIPGVAEFIAIILRKAGHRVEAAEDGTTAIRVASELKPEIVVLDIKLPDMDGYELAR
ncbi:MAG: MEDS domain-containing protein, partial [Chitinivibrionales bacterium]|nr:MEDS domain-containing protein [Chitinivibrionales bacterium]